MKVSEKNTRNNNDRGGTRSGTERRRFTIKGHTPERRFGRERRNGVDRRKGQNARGRKAIERRDAFRKNNDELQILWSKS